MIFSEVAKGHYVGYRKDLISLDIFAKHESSRSMKDSRGV